MQRLLLLRLLITSTFSLVKKLFLEFKQKLKIIKKINIKNKIKHKKS